MRGVAFPSPDAIISASRDATVRLWKLLSAKPPTYDCTLSSHGTSFINTVAYVRASDEFPNGLVVSGGKDAIIEVRQPHKVPQDNADALLVGHQANVCALDVSEDGKTIVSGGWDQQARVWQVGTWESTAELRGHQGSVWAVLAYDNATIITGKNVLAQLHKLNTLVVRFACRLWSVFTASRGSLGTPPRYTFLSDLLYINLQADQR